jgi:transcriptional regulator with XRE-family HTH domain
MFDDNAISIDVGSRLRTIRAERRLSLRALAYKSGLSANALSNIERGQTSATVGTLYKLAEALGVPITTFFEGVDKGQEIVHRKANQRVRVPFARGLWEGMGGESFTEQVEPFMLTLESGATSGPFSISHSGAEFVICLRGQIEYQVKNKIYLLDVGDSLLFAANLSHRWRNPGSSVTNVLVLLSNFAEKDRQAGFHTPQVDKE